MTKDRKQTFTVSELAGRPRMQIMTQNVTPSWKRFGDGTNHVDAWFHKTSITLDVAETSHGNNNRTTEKRVMVSIDEPAAREMLKQLQAMFAEKPS